MNEPASTSRETRDAAVDLAIALVMGVGWTAAKLVSSIGVAIAVVVLGMLVWLARVLARDRGGLRELGLRVDNLRAATGPVLGFTLVAALGIVGYGVALGTPLPARDLLILLPVYPVWGVAQQLVIQGLVFRRVGQLVGRDYVSIAITGVVFGLLHAPHWPLVGLTTAAGLVWSWLYSRWPNVWLLGLSHGTLAALAYPIALATNPLTDGTL